MAKLSDICPTPPAGPPPAGAPLAPAIYPTSVWRCEDIDSVQATLEGRQEGYVYQRDRHPNADMLADKCRRLHEAEQTAVVASGMSAMALFVLSQLTPGSHVVVGRQAYGHSLRLLNEEAARWGVRCTLADTCDLAATEAAITADTSWIVVETIANPLLRVADIAALAELAHRRHARLLVDNTFASPVICRPLTLGADLVLESVSKFINGHSDVMLGVLCGGSDLWERVPLTSSTWGLSCGPFDSWLALRGLATLPLRMERACENAHQVAEFLTTHSKVRGVEYPGLAGHPDHALAQSQFAGRFGAMAAFHLHGGRDAAQAFIRAAKGIPFTPSLGEVSTTLSHPSSTSHRSFSEEQKAALGIEEGTIRLSVGTESIETIFEELKTGLDA